VFAGRSLLDITPQDCRNAQAGFRKRYSASTVNLIMSTASKIFNLAGEEGILDKNPMQYVKRVQEPPPRDRLLSKEEWERLWKELEKDILLMRLVTLATNLPLRRAQLLAITPDAIDIQTESLLICQSKGRAARRIPLNNTTVLILSQMLADEQLPFPLKETGIRKRWTKALKRAGIENFRFHDLRRCMATELSNNGVPGETIRKLYGHSAMKITQVYISPEMEEMSKAVRTLDNVQESDLVQ
jgi:integrase